jgi:predicted protein tyrosine phosphatase
MENIVEGPVPEIRTCGLSNLDRDILKYEPDLIISICNEPHDRSRADKMLEICTDAPVLRLNFEDAEFVPSHGSSTVASLSMFKDLFSKVDDLFPQSPPDVILAHCTMGISRSTATGLVVAAHIAKGFYSDFNAENWARDQVDLLYKTNPHAEPNRRVLRIGAHLLGDVGEHILNEIVERS